MNHIRIYKLIVELIPNDWIQLLKTEASQESLLKVFCFNNRGTKKLKTFRNVQTKKSTLLYKIITRIIINLLSLFHEQIKLKGILLSTLKPWAKFFLTDSKNFRMVIFGYTFSIWYKFVHFSLPLGTAIHRMGNTPTTLYPKGWGMEGGVCPPPPPPQ